MKKALHYWFSFLLILFLGSEMLVSCKAKQPLQEVTKESTDTTDFTSVKELTEINKEITDQLIWQLSQVKTSNPECDSITQAYLFHVLNSINTQKSSGDNSYSLKFNALERQLELLVNISETKNSSRDSIATKIIEKNFYHTREVPVRLPLTWYQKMAQYLAIIALMLIAFKIFSFIKSKS